jgi:hypothetical protein
MPYEIINILGLVAIGYALWRQQQRIEDAEMMIGYTLSLLDDEEEDVSYHHET